MWENTCCDFYSTGPDQLRPPDGRGGVLPQALRPRRAAGIPAQGPVQRRVSGFTFQIQIICFFLFMREMRFVSQHSEAAQPEEAGDAQGEVVEPG